MKRILFGLSLMVSLSAFGGTEKLSYHDHIEMKKVVMDEILIQNLTHLYSDNFFDETLVAKDEGKKKSSWSDKLRTKLSGCPGVYTI